MYEVSRNLPEFTGYLMLTELEPELTLAQCMLIAPTANIMCEKTYRVDPYGAGAQAICDMLLGKITNLYFKSHIVNNRFLIYCNREDVVKTYNSRYHSYGNNTYCSTRLWLLVESMKLNVPNLRLEFQDHARLPPAYELTKNSPDAKMINDVKYIGNI